MKYTLEIQNEGFNINETEIVRFVKKSLKDKKVILSKVKDLEIYYVVDTKIVYYKGIFNDKIVKGEIYIV